MFETNAKYQYFILLCQYPSGVILGSPQLIISIKLVTDSFEYALLSANRPKLTVNSSAPPTWFLAYWQLELKTWYLIQTFYTPD